MRGKLPWSRSKYPGEWKIAMMEDVREYRSMLKAMYAAVGTRDIYGACKTLRQDTWNSAPNLKRLMASADYARVVADVCPGMRLKDLLLCKALKAEHLEQPCIFADKPMDEALSDISKAIRIAIAKWRDVRKNWLRRRNILKKALEVYMGVDERVCINVDTSTH